MFIIINHTEQSRSTISGIISRMFDEQFYCTVFWPTGYMNDDRKIKLERSIETYINEKSKVSECDYLVCMRKIRFTIPKTQFEKFDIYRIRARTRMNKYVKPVGE